MSNRTFILAIVAIILAASGYMMWLENDSTPIAPAPKTQYEDKIPKTQKPNTTPTEKSRFSSLSDRSLRWQVRVENLRNMDIQALNSEDIDELYEWLKYQPQVGEKEDWYVIANEIMEQMRQQGIGSQRYTDNLIKVISDPAQDKVIRDYAIQHLSIWLAPRGSSNNTPYEKDSAKVTSAIQTLTSVIIDSSTQNSSIPGTALMGLVDFHQVDPRNEIISDSFEKLSPWLSDVITGKQNPSLITQTSAINAVAMMQRVEYLPAIRDLVQSASTNESAKLSSIAALGYLAEDSDIPTLQSIADSNTKFKHAAQAALIKISNR